MPPTSQRPDPALARSTTAAGLLGAVSALVVQLEDGASGRADAADAQVERVLRRLRASVLRPLQQVAGTVARPAAPAPATARTDQSEAGGHGLVGHGRELDTAIWDLAVEPSKLAQRADCPVAVREAVAALQDLACSGVVTGRGFDSARSAELRALQASHEPEITTLRIEPLADLLTTLPVGPEHPGRTAGATFELFYQPDYLLPHRRAAWLLMSEHLSDAAAIAESAGVDDERLRNVADSLRGYAETLKSQAR